SRLGASVADRVLLRLADPADFGLAGVPSRAVPAGMPPGRVLCVADEVEAQVALLDPDPSGPAQVAAVRRIAATTALHGPPPPLPRPMRVEPLPDCVEVEDVRAEAKASATGPWWALVGVGGDEPAPVGVDLADSGPGFVICGPPGSGRSTALATMGRWLAHLGHPTVLVGHPRSSLMDLRTEPGVVGCLGAGDDRALARLLSAHDDGLVVMADDVETLHDTPVERPLTDLLRPHAAHRGVLLLAGGTAELAGFYRGLTVEARRSRCGLLLGAVTPVDGDLFGVRVPRADDRRPGRGLLVVRGRTHPVQVAVSEPP
ncbi:MAG TPA: cell division protein FtsK, partial [Candidatus Eisenbacteria bacterium]|nr:cell division protein FtsK [Candidatus Eisenbacteria bacterium]